jgi:DNA-binding MarR family transcriptional regulator
VSVVLRLEKDGPATVSSLARAEGMRPQSMASIVTVLESAGLLNGAPDPADGRQTLLSLTDACRKRVAAGRAARQDWLTRTLQARLSLREQDELAKAVALLKRLVDD